MEPAKYNPEAQPSATVIDFEAALLGACPPELRQELETEAELLASALPRAGRAQALRTMAEAICTSGSDPQMDRRRARRLAAALRRLARRLDG
jgi:hypothetical protein